MITQLVTGTNEYLQPNPGFFITPFLLLFFFNYQAIRARIATLGAVSKLRGSAKSQAYPQTEGMLADTMTKYGRGLGSQSDFGKVICNFSVISADFLRTFFNSFWQRERFT